MHKLTGVFPHSQAALLAAEKAREVAGTRASVRVIMPGGSQSVVETSVLADASGWQRIVLLCSALGVVGGVVFALLGSSWTMVILGLLWGVGAGLMLGMWLTGEMYPSRILTEGVARERYAELTRGGRSVVIVVCATDEESADVRAAFEMMGGSTSEGFLHELPADLPLPAPRI